MALAQSHPPQPALRSSAPLGPSLTLRSSAQLWPLAPQAFHECFQASRSVILLRNRSHCSRAVANEIELVLVGGVKIPWVQKQRLLRINYSESQNQLTNFSDLVILRTSTRFIAC